MTKLEFLKVLARLDPNLMRVPPEMQLHSVAFLVAANCWIKERSDDDDTKALRRELRFIIEHERFSFQVITDEKSNNGDGSLGNP